MEFSWCFGSEHCCATSCAGGKFQRVAKCKRPKHISTSVSLILEWVRFLLDTWLQTQKPHGFLFNVYAAKRVCLKNRVPGAPSKFRFFWVPAAYTIGPFSDWPICHSLFLVHPSDPSFCQELWRKWNKARNIPCASERSSSSILYFPQQKLGLRWIKGIWWLYVPLYRQCMIMIDNVVKPTINHPQDGHKWLVKNIPIW